MQITLQNLGKRFNRHWIFRNLDYSFETGNAYAITGPNGSGKSTLLQVIAGSVQQSTGSVQFGTGQAVTDTHECYRHLAMAAPYLELIEELSLTEFLDFHGRFKAFIAPHNTASIIRYIGLENATHQQIRYFSSGMKQRVKLAQAFFSNVPLLILDEPTSNLDANGIALYFRMLADFGADRILLIGSNDEEEIRFCSHRLSITGFKNNTPATP